MSILNLIPLLRLKDNELLNGNINQM